MSGSVLSSTEKAGAAPEVILGTMHKKKQKKTKDL